MLIALLRSFLRRYSRALAYVVVLQLLATLAALYLPSLNADIIDNGVAKADTSYILEVGAVMLAVTFVQIICSIAAVYFGARTAMGFGRDTRAAVFHRVGSFSAREVTQFGAPSLITRTTNDVQQVQMLVLLTCTLMVSAPIMCVGGIIMALREDLGLSWLIVVSVTVLVAAIAVIVSQMIPQFRQMQKRIDVVNRVLREQITGIRVVRAFVREPVERQRFGQANGELTDTAIRVGRLMSFMFPTVMLVLNVSSVAVLWFGGHRVAAGEMQVGELHGVPELPDADPHVDHDGDLHAGPRSPGRGLRRAADRGAGDRLVGGPARQPADVGHGRRHGRAARASFPYPGADHPVLREISFRALPGQTTAIIGSTGAGKTTLLSLIPRLFDATSGTVLVDGVDVTPAGPRPAARPARPRPAEGVPVHRHHREQPALRPAGRHRRRALGRVAHRRRPTTSWQPCPRVCSRRSRRAAPTSPAASDSASPSPARSSAGPRSTSSTTRSRRSTWPPTPGCGQRCGPITRESTVLMVAQRVSSIVDADQILVVDDGARGGRRHPRRAGRVLPDVRRDRPLAAAGGGGGMSQQAAPPRPPAGGRMRGPARDDERRDAGREVDGLLALGQAAARAGCGPNGCSRSRRSWPDRGGRDAQRARAEDPRPRHEPHLRGRHRQRLPAGITQQQAIDAARARGDDGFADLLSGMTVVPGQGIDFDALSRTLMLVLFLYVGSALTMLLQG